MVLDFNKIFVPLHPILQKINQNINKKIVIA